MAEPLPLAPSMSDEAVRVRLRPAREGEGTYLPDVERSAGQLYRESEGLEWLADAGDLPAEFHERLICAGTCWVAVSQAEQIVGFLSAERILDTLHIWEFSIAYGWQGKGIGRRIMDHVIEQAQRRACADVTLTTLRGVPWNAPFYARMGFREVFEFDARLKRLIHQEEAMGFAPGSRCAMRKDLAR